MKKSETKNNIPAVVYIFSLSVFALGLATYVPIGITQFIANGMHVEATQVGSVIAVYALGATFSAPILTALTNGWSRKRILLFAMFLFSLGSLGVAFSNSLNLMLVSRFISGFGHGTFLAVAASTAARLVGTKQAGTATAIVFGGMTISMAFGVPFSTYLGTILDWRWIMALIALFGVIGMVGLMVNMKNPLPAPDEFRLNVKKELNNIIHPKLLSASLVTIFAYAGAFTVYTYITTILADQTHLSQLSITFYIFLFGIFAAIGNLFGGKLADRLGIDRANVVIISGIGLMALLITIFGSSAFAMAVLVSLLGFFTFASVPALQARLMATAHKHTENGQNVASGLNISGFSLAIAGGSIIGGLTIQYIGLLYTGFVGSILSGIGLFILLYQVRISTEHGKLKKQRRNVE